MKYKMFKKLKFFFRSNECSPLSNNSDQSTNNCENCKKSFSSNSVLVEQRFQELLAAENQAAATISRARLRRKEFLRRVEDESRIEIEVFRRFREEQYRLKLCENESNDRLQEELDFNRQKSLEQLDAILTSRGNEIVNELIRCFHADLEISESFQ